MLEHKGEVSVYVKRERERIERGRVDRPQTATVHRLPSPSPRLLLVPDYIRT